MKHTLEPLVPAGSRLFKGAVILGAAAVISKLLGTLQKIPLQNIAGDETFGIYNAVYPIYIVILLLATAGFPISVSKFVSEQTAAGRIDEARRILRLSSYLLLASGFAFFLLLFFGAGRIAALIGNAQTKPAIQSVSFALLFVPLMASLRGYFQGLQDMIPTGVSQVVEQVVRVGTMIWLLLLFIQLGYSESRIAAGATFGSVTGAFAGLLVMGYYWWKAHKYGEYRTRTKTADVEPTLRLLKRFVSYALPVCLGTIVLPILNMADTFTMPRLLEGQGFSESEAMHLFGVYGRGLPLVQLVALVATSTSVALVPAIAEAKLRGQWGTIKLRTELALRFTWLIGLASSIGLVIAVVPINIMFYENDEGSLAMALLAFTALFSTVNIVSGSILQGMGAVMIPARNLFIAALVKVGCNLLLIPLWDIEGAALSAVIAFALAGILNMVHLRRITGARFSLANYLFKPLAALLWMGIALIGLIYGMELLQARLPIVLSHRLFYTCTALIAVAGGAVVYVYALFRTGAVSKDDFENMPNTYQKLRPFLVKLKLIR